MLYFSSQEWMCYNWGDNLNRSFIKDKDTLVWGSEVGLLKKQSQAVLAMAQWIKNLTAVAWVVAGAGRTGLKDPALLQLWHRLQLRFSPWPGNSHMPWMWALKIHFNLKKKAKLYLKINNKLNTIKCNVKRQ